MFLTQFPNPDTQQMDDDFFGDSSPPVQQLTSACPQSTPNEDEFDFGTTEYQTPATDSLPAYNSNSNVGGFGNMDFVDVETVRKIHEEEELIQKKLREKSEQQYDQKRQRKQEGRRQFQEFTEKKIRQTQLRKEQNKNREQLKLKQIKKLSEEAGWKKVSANVGLKQGENKGKKDTNRMRQAILNKRADEGL